MIVHPVHERVKPIVGKSPEQVTVADIACGKAVAILAYILYEIGKHSITRTFRLHPEEKRKSI